ncbi:MAG: hypothetical protein V1494_02265 [Candidatus Diapherotrites archaeon]
MPSKMGKSGQEEAPFELLIAVVVMTFVITIGLYAVNVLRDKQCEGELEKSLGDLQQAIQIVANGQGTQTVTFAIPSCYQETEGVTETKISYEQETHTCTYYCGSYRNECTLLKFYNPEHSTSKCLFISSSTAFTSDSCTDFSREEGYEVVNWHNSIISSGRYTLISKFNAFSSNPVLCVYKKILGG